MAYKKERKKKKVLFPIFRAEVSQQNFHIAKKGIKENLVNEPVTENVIAFPPPSLVFLY